MTNRKTRKQAAKLRRAKRRARFTFEQAVARAIGGTLIYRDKWSREGISLRLSCHAGAAMVVDHNATNPLAVAMVRRYAPTPADVKATDWRATT